MLTNRIVKRSKVWITHCLLLLTVFGFSESLAQDIDLQAELDTTSIRLGEQTEVKVKVSVKVNEGQRVQLPFKEFGTKGMVEILAQSPIDTSIENGNTILTTNLKITSFDSGAHRLPLIVMSEKDNNVQLDTFWTPELQVALVPVDTSQVFRPIKGQLSAPVRAKTIMFWVIVALLVIGSALGLYFYFNKKGKEEVEIVDAGPVRPAHEIALEQLEVLDGQKLWQAGQVKPYYIQLTDIIRNYLEGQFRLPAMESTTDEIMLGVRSTSISDKAKMNLRELLELSDLVKFAKMQPGMDEHTKSMGYAREFVVNTKPEETIVQAEDATEETQQEEPETSSTQST